MVQPPRKISFVLLLRCAVVVHARKAGWSQTTSVPQGNLRMRVPDVLQGEESRPEKLIIITHTPTAAPSTAPTAAPSTAPPIGTTSVAETTGLRPVPHAEPSTAPSDLISDSPSDFPSDMPSSAPTIILFPWSGVSPVMSMPSSAPSAILFPWTSDSSTASVPSVTNAAGNVDDLNRRGVDPQGKALHVPTLAPTSTPQLGTLKMTMAPVSPLLVEHGSFIAATPSPVNSTVVATGSIHTAATNTVTSTTTTAAAGGGSNTSATVAAGSGLNGTSGGSFYYNNTTETHLPQNGSFEFEHGSQGVSAGGVVYSNGSSTTSASAQSQSSSGGQSVASVSTSSTSYGGNSWMQLSSVISNWLHGGVAGGNGDNSTAVSVSLASLQGGSVLEVNTSVQVPVGGMMNGGSNSSNISSVMQNQSASNMTPYVSPEPRANQTYSVSTIGCRPFKSLRNVTGAVSLSDMHHRECIPSCTQTVVMPFPFYAFGTELVPSIEVSSTGSINLNGNKTAPMGPVPIMLADTSSPESDYIHVPRISVAQGAIYPPVRGSIDVMVYNSKNESLVVSWESVILQRYLQDESAGVANFQIELFSSGSFELRWGAHTIVQQTDRVAAGIMDDQRIPPLAVPAILEVFDKSGETIIGQFPPKGSCNLFMPVLTNYTEAAALNGTISANADPRS
jgi:hypothetical protein